VWECLPEIKDHPNAYTRLPLPNKDDGMGFERCLGLAWDKARYEPEETMTG